MVEEVEWVAEAEARAKVVDEARVAAEEWAVAWARGREVAAYAQTADTRPNTSRATHAPIKPAPTATPL